MTCPSVNVWAGGPGNRLIRDHCIRTAGHRGECYDSYGHSWTRVGEWQRQAREAACQRS